MQRNQIELLRRRRLTATETEEIQENPADNKGKELEVGYTRAVFVGHMTLLCDSANQISQISRIVIPAA